MPDRNDEHGIWITFDGNRRRYYGNAFDDVIPQRRLVVADQCWADGTSNAPTKIAGTENDGRVETVIKPQKSSGALAARIELATWLPRKWRMRIIANSEFPSKSPDGSCFIPAEIHFLRFYRCQRKTYRSQELCHRSCSVSVDMFMNAQSDRFVPMGESRRRLLAHLQWNFDLELTCVF